ncbi:MAG: Tfp pilus assembly protein FimT/FimU [Candidatus Brocadiia bacterium]
MKNPKIPRRPPARAFTLTELLVVIAIITLVAAMSVAAMMPMLEGRALRGGARIVKSMLYQARSYAVLHGRQTVVLFDKEESSVRAYAGNTVADLGAIGKVQYLPSGCKFPVYPTRSGCTIRAKSPSPPKNNEISRAIVFTRSGGLLAEAWPGGGGWDVDGDGSTDEDGIDPNAVDGIDDDSDGSIDEDPAGDADGDGDDDDDGDGDIDEDMPGTDDDGDGIIDEDPFHEWNPQGEACNWSVWLSDNAREKIVRIDVTYASGMTRSVEE